MHSTFQLLLSHGTTRNDTEESQTAGHWLRESQPQHCIKPRRAAPAGLPVRTAEIEKLPARPPKNPPAADREAGGGRKGSLSADFTSCDFRPHDSMPEKTTRFPEKVPSRSPTNSEHNETMGSLSLCP